MFGWPYERERELTPEEQEQRKLNLERYEREKRYQVLMDVIKQRGSVQDHAQACDFMVAALEPIVRKLLEPPTAG